MSTIKLTGLRGSLPERAVLTDDPMRARMLAAHWLENAAPLYELRGLEGCVGGYRGAGIALLSVGYGESAALLYLHEAAQLGVKRVIYMGECVSHEADLRLRDVIIPEGADPALLACALEAARQSGLSVNILGVTTDDRFFLGAGGDSRGITDFASGAVARYAAGHGLAALSILTVSQNTANGEGLEEHERQSRFHDAARLTFEALALDAGRRPISAAER